MLTRSIILTMICLLSALTGLQAQTNYALTAPAASGLPGSTVEVPIELGTPTDAQGFQFGLSHVAPTLTLSSVEQGAALLVTNNGAGADFFTTELAPLGGPGLIIGVIVSLAPPLETIPGGTHDVAHVIYTVAADASPGSTTALAFLNTLGDPPVSCVISVNGVSQQPILNHGSFTVETPAPSGISVAIDDACTCSGTLSWTNEAAYDSIEVTQDGITTSHAGTATSASISLTDGVLTDFDVVGISNGQSSAAGMGTGICTQTPPSTGPSGLTCEIDHLSCTVTLNWFNNDPAYQELTLLVDGVVSATLPGDASTTSVTLSAELIDFTLEITGSGACGEALPGVSCVVACLPERFKRGDVNIDGTLDISDAIGTLNYLFQNLPLGCLDAVDANDDGNLDISDAVSILNYIFAGGAPPAAPGPTECGVDSTDDALDCTGYNTDLCN
ncbi:MAG: hypothetical protein HRU16_11305 [Planctomycetes bacterium]|nr:hypothetical protein [Planctomycetota bacterium]